MDRSSATGRPAATAGIRCQVDIDVDGRFGWRLVAINGRSVAVSLTSYDTHARCRTAFHRLCSGHADMGGGIQHSSEGGGWVWVLWDTAGRHLARSARTYERHATCRSAYGRFRALLPELATAGTELWAQT
ncbi:hypothetical protein [Streptomyces brasiliensis]|uniref:DUF1508 domain-containing protein n=1 Tax=Streptomyces brasiliensis TaxID=1954 RepID=A0A917KP67_9ACTN|nr:hypothetical protein [Streptomyces brasiliensis]GGJ21174.1 hypothetical protein GCM10010121_035250 [Streptomyces brasiliensis]